LGRWQKNDLPWYETNILTCDLCGKMIPHQIWLVEFEEKELKFCNEECENLYFNYWLPKHGLNIPS